MREKNFGKIRLKLMTAIETTSEGISIVDENESFIYMNQAYAKIFGYDSPKELIGKTWRILYREKELHEFEQSYLPELKEYGCWRGEVFGRKKDGSIFVEEISLKALDTGEVICVCRDVTKRKQAQEALENSHDDLEQRVKERTAELNSLNKALKQEISEHELTEAALKRQQKFIQLVADTATNFIFVKDKDGRFLFANKAMATSFGKTPEELINKHNAEIHGHPQELKKYLQYDAEVLRTMRPVEIEETQTLKDGKVLHFQTVKTPFVVDNQTVHVLGVSTDITRLKKAEQKLHEERYRTVVDQSADCIFLADVETGQIVEANPAFQRLLGYSQEEVQKFTIYDFVAHPRQDIDQRMQRARKQGRLFLGERLYRCKDQTLVSVEVNTSVVSYGGRKVFCVVARDMAERKQAEKEIARLKELYSHILDSLPFQIGLFDLDGRFLYVNAAAMKNADMREWIIGKTHIDYCKKRKISEDIGKRRFEALKECIQKGKIVSYEEKFPCRHRMGYRDFIRHFCPVMNTGGEAIQVIGYSVEITEQKRAEAAQKKLEAQMQHAQKLESLGVLAGGIAHDFNNLLTGILGNAQLAQLELTDISPACENLADIEKAATRAAVLCKQLLAYSGKGRFVVKPTHLNEVIKEMAHLLKISISKNVALEYHLQEDLPAIEADAAQMHQVIMNLIINASEAIKENNGIVTLRTGIMECDRKCLEQMFLHDNLSEGRYVFAEVADSGCGMDEETQKKIFDPFFTTKFTGRGLGMAAVLGIVRSHNGAIKIESAPEEGTTVRILFPASGQVADISNNGVQNTMKIQGAGTILVVDDEEVVRKMGRRILERAGFTVLTAEDGYQGIEIFRRKTAEIILVLLDLTMPRMNGEETLQKIHAIRKDVPVILLSGYSEQEVFKHSSHLRWSGFIQKPFQVHTLMAKVDEVLKR